jgi:hypothetical protein
MNAKYLEGAEATKCLVAVRPFVKQRFDSSDHRSNIREILVVDAIVSVRLAPSGGEASFLVKWADETAKRLDLGRDNEASAYFGKPSELLLCLGEQIGHEI